MKMNSLKVAQWDSVNIWKTSFGQKTWCNLMFRLWSEYEHLHCIFPICLGRTSGKMTLNINSLYSHIIWDKWKLIAFSANSQWTHKNIFFLFCKAPQYSNSPSTPSVQFFGASASSISVTEKLESCTALEYFLK